MPARQVQQAIAHVAGALRRRKELGGFHLLDEWQAELALEEDDLFAERPRPHDPPDQMSREHR